MSLAASDMRDALRADLSAIAETGCRVLAGDAVGIVVSDDAGATSVESWAGLTPREVANLQRATGVGLRERWGEDSARVLSADLVLAGERLGSIYAVRRAAGAFENAELIDTFAAQAALTVGMHHRAGFLDERPSFPETLDRLALSAHNATDLSRALNDVIGPLFGGARTAVMVVDAQSNMLQMIPGSFGADEQVTASHRVSVFDQRSNSARVLTTGRPYISNVSLGDLGIRQDYVDVFSISRVLTVPLRDLGVLHIVDAGADFDVDDALRAEALAPQIANIVELTIRLLGHERRQRLEETLAGLAVAVASGQPFDTFLAPALKDLAVINEASMLALVVDDAPTIVARVGDCNEELEQTVLEEAGSEPGMRAYVVGPEKAGRPGWATFYVPVHLRGVRVGTLAALRVRGEPFSRVERESFVRLVNLVALAYATEHYQRQRAEVARLQERQRIADDLHDDVAQILFAAQLCLDGVLSEEAVSGDLADRIVQARGLLIRGDTVIRTVIQRLSSGPPAADIATRLASVVSGVEDEFSLAVRLQVDDGAAVRAKDLRRPASDALVRVARESLVNVAKHAGPCRVAVTLEVSRGDRLMLTISDDGCGVVSDGEGRRHGLTSLRHLLREHDGSLRICASRAGGTRVVASMPL